MKRTTRRVLCAAVCAVFLFCMAAPALALTGSEAYSFIDSDDYARVACASTLTLTKGTSKITLSFVDNLPHYDEDEYTCLAEVYIHFTAGNDAHTFSSAPGMTCTAIAYTNGKTANGSLHIYYVFGVSNEVYRKQFGTM